MGKVPLSPPVQGLSVIGLGTAPPDKYNAAYFIFFNLGAGFLFPWNAFITAADYFGAIYPGKHVDRLFAIFYMVPNFVTILLLLRFGRHYTSRARVFYGFCFFLALLAFVPLLDAIAITDGKGTTLTLALTVAGVALLGASDAVVQGSLFGLGAELPDRYIQALNGGTGASGLMVSLLRLLTKAALPATTAGLRQSANLYFFVSGLFVASCILCFKILETLPVIRYHRAVRPISSPLLYGEVSTDLENDQDSYAGTSPRPLESPRSLLARGHFYSDALQVTPPSEKDDLAMATDALAADAALSSDPDSRFVIRKGEGLISADKGERLGPNLAQADCRSGHQVGVSYKGVLLSIWPEAFALALVYLITLSIFPGYLAEDVHSAYLGDWYPIILITLYNLGDFLGKMSPAISPIFSPTIDTPKPLVWASLSRLLFYPAFILALHGPHILRTEMPMVVLTLLLGLSNGYLTSLLMMSAPKRARSEEAEAVGMLMVLSLVSGLTLGAFCGWAWIL